MKSYLFLQDCLGNNPIDRTWHISAGDTNPDTGKAYAINPASGNWDDNYFASHFGGASSSGGAGNFQMPQVQDPLTTAKQLQQFNVQSNQPAIASLGNQSTDLQTRYSDLLTSIKGQAATANAQGSVAVNAQTAATALGLGQRGILPSSYLGQQQMAQALLPATTANQAAQGQFGNLISQTGLSEQGDINQIASQIASLQAGNPEQAGQTAQGIYQAQTAAATAAQQIQAQQTMQTEQLKNAMQIAQLQNQYRPISMGGGLYNTATGQTVNGGNSGGFSLGGGIPSTNNTSIAKIQPATVSNQNKQGNIGPAGVVNYQAPAQQPKLNLASPPSYNPTGGIPDILGGIGNWLSNLTKPSNATMPNALKQSNPNNYLGLGF